MGPPSLKKVDGVFGMVGRGDAQPYPVTFAVCNCGIGELNVDWIDFTSVMRSFLVVEFRKHMRLMSLPISGCTNTPDSIPRMSGTLAIMNLSDSSSGVGSAFSSPVFTYFCTVCNGDLVATHFVTLLKLVIPHKVNTSCVNLAEARVSQFLVLGHHRLLHFTS